MRELSANVVFFILLIIGFAGFAITAVLSERGPDQIFIFTRSEYTTILYAVSASVMAVSITSLIKEYFNRKEREKLAIPQRAGIDNIITDIRDATGREWANILKMAKKEGIILGTKFRGWRVDNEFKRELIEIAGRCEVTFLFLNPYQNLQKLEARKKQG